MAATSLHEWNRRAEEYFATLSNWQHHLAKPFSRTDEAPALLINLAVLLQGVRLLPGETVLDFGAGTGWLSRYLTQLGCRTILLDVSATALKIAAETYRRIPVLGDRPEPVYLLFDGRRIELPDQSVDHIVCFDAFHHAPNPEEILREFGRILKPGGSAGFAEPGPTHSQMPQSQFEMRTYGVLENDIDLPALWPVARESGFTDLRVAAFNIPPFLVSLQEFHDLLDGGATFKQWADSTRDFLRHVRNFVLMKGDVAGRDSRRVEGLRAEIAAEILREPNKDSLSLRATVTNAGTSVWLPSTDSPGAVWLGVHLYDTAGRLLNFELARAPISASDVAPDQIVELELDLPPLPPGECILELDCVAEQVTWFSQVGSPTTTIRVTGG